MTTILEAVTTHNGHSIKFAVMMEWIGLVEPEINYEFDFLNCFNSFLIVHSFGS
jgi:hypothetical protein